MKGRRTYITAVIIAIATGLKFLDIINQEAYTAILGLLTALGLTTARAGAIKSYDKDSE